MNTTRLLLLLALAGTTLGCASARLATPSPIPPPTTPASTVAADPSPSGQGCYYVWATQELPVASKSFESAMQTVVKGSAASAYAFGEDCVAADGTRTFLAMETDFRVRIPVANLSDEADLGDLMAASIKAIDQLPREQIEGPQPGRVEFEFTGPNSDSLRLTVELEQYLAKGQGLSGAALFNMFYIKP